MTPITLLIVATVSALGAVFVTRNAGVNQPIPPDQNRQNQKASPPSPLETVRVDVTLKPEVTALSMKDMTYYHVSIDSYNLGVSGIQTELVYDPKVFTIEDIIPGPFLIQPVVLTKTINPTEGKISYALGSLKYSTGVGTLFSIQVKAVNKTAVATLKNPLSFVRENTKVGLASQEKDKRYSEAETVIVFAEVPVTIVP